MSSKLVIVESPAKAKTIGKYLGEDFKVEASMGHIRDLPNSRLGIETEKDFEPEYEVIESRRKTVAKLKKAVKEADEFYLAPDPDREGEAIAWHLAEALRLPSDRTYRVTFNEITKRAVQAAFTSPGRIDQRKVDAQQARRILDRLVGYKISPLLWKKVAKGLSAGRVQSVAVRLIVEKEREIEAFQTEEYWRLIARLAARQDRPEKPQPFLAELRRLDGQEVGLGKPVPIRTGQQAADLKKELESAAYKVAEIRKKRQKSYPAPPLITSTLQQQASNRLGFTAQRTMRIAQQLYEGIDIGGGEGQVGLITYMRTDSVRVSEDALQAVRSVIRQDFGEKYLPPSPNYYKSKPGAQEAHEAIRPTDVNRTPDSLKSHLDAHQYKLYRLIWERFVASQMPPAEYDVTEADVEAGRGLFVARGRVMIFDGHLRVADGLAEKKAAKPKPEEEDNGNQGAEMADQVLPPLETGQALDLLELCPSQHFTKPPPRYTEASLVRALEKEGIGRPSTYAPIISTIQDRGYVQREGRQLHPTELGVLVTDKLVRHFPDIMDIKFTSGMEENLDKVEEGADWIRTTREFYDLFKKDLDKAVLEMEKVNFTHDVDVICEKCGKKMVVRLSKHGKFLGCSGYPDCENKKPLPGGGDAEQPAERPKPETTDEKCEQCGKPMAVRLARRGRSRGARFLSCSGYPKCKSIKPYSTGVACPREGCGGVLLEKAAHGRVFYGCSRYPECRQALSELPTVQGKDAPAPAVPAPADAAAGV